MIISNPFIFLIAFSSAGFFLNLPRKSLLISCFSIVLAALLVPFIQLSDNVSYEYFFENSLYTSGKDSEFEIGYLLLNKLLSNFVPYETFRAFFIFITLTAKIYLLFKLAKLIPVALVFYFSFQFYVDAYLVRASFSATFAALALFFRYKGMPVKGVFLLSAAVAFHLSAIAVVPLWFLVNFEITRRMHMILFVSLMAASQFPLAVFTAELLSNVFPSANAVILLASYVDSTHGQSAGIFRGSVLVYSLIHLSFIFKIDNTKIKFSKLNNFVLNCMLFAIAMLLVFNDMVVVSDRIARFTLFFYVIGLTHVLSSFDRQSRTVLSFFVVLLSLLVGLLLDEGPYDII